MQSVTRVKNPTSSESRSSALLPRPHRKGAVVAISPEKPARDAGPDCAFRRHHPIHRTVGDIARGGVRGGNPLPGKENHTGPPTGLPRRSGGSRGKSPGGAQPEKRKLGGRRPIHRSPISPTPPAPSALLPRPRGRGQ